jgi:hypothetical protein
MQSNVGNVKKGSLFAFLQSNGAGGFASNAVKMAGKWVLIAVILAAVGKLLIEKGMAEENACGVLEKCWTSVTKDLKTVST